MRPDTIKHLEKYTVRILFDIKSSNILFDPPPSIITIRTQINKWDLIKPKAFAQQRRPFKKGKYDCRSGVNATDKGLISKIYKQLMQLNNSKKQKTQLKTGHKT